MTKEITKTRKWLYLGLIFLCFFALDQLIMSSSQEIFDDRRREVCVNAFDDTIQKCELVKGSLIIYLKNDQVFPCTIRAPNENNLSAESSKDVETGDIFQKKANSDAVIIKKKTGLIKYWKIECPVKQ